MPVTHKEFRALNKMFPDAVGDCPYCLDDVDITFLVSYKGGTNTKRLYFQIITESGEETWVWNNKSWRPTRDFVEKRKSSCWNVL